MPPTAPIPPPTPTEAPTRITIRLPGRLPPAEPPAEPDVPAEPDALGDGPENEEDELILPPEYEALVRKLKDGMMRKMTEEVVCKLETVLPSIIERPLQECAEAIVKATEKVGGV